MYKYTLSVLAASAVALSSLVFETGCIGGVETVDSSEDNINGGPADFGPCEPVDACEVAALDSNGVCVRTPIPGCALCVADGGAPGTTRDGGACCASCWAGQTCYPSPDAAACGASGGLCAPCLSGSMRCSATGACTW